MVDQVSIEQVCETSDRPSPCRASLRGEDPSPVLRTHISYDKTRHHQATLWHACTIQAPRHLYRERGMGTTYTRLDQAPRHDAHPLQHRQEALTLHDRHDNTTLQPLNCASVRSFTHLCPFFLSLFLCMNRDLEPKLIDDKEYADWVQVIGV
jgi:hypothetical protein